MADEVVLTESQTAEQAKAQALADFWKAAEERAVALSNAVTPKRNVIPFSLQGDTDTDHVLGFMYELDGMTDIKLSAAKLTGAQASLPLAVEAIESLVLFSESDPRLGQRKYLKGAALALLSTIELALPEKKTV